MRSATLSSRSVFLSTPSARRATFRMLLNSALISLFLSTPSARRATNCNNFAVASSKISIHALREEGDTTAARLTGPSPHFYPRPPRGGRPRVVAVVADPDLFLSTPSARRATHRPTQGDQDAGISIHALREEGDASPRAMAAEVPYFYPRPPRGGRRWSPACCRPGWYFYPRPPRGGRPAASRP